MDTTHIHDKLFTPEGYKELKIPIFNGTQLIFVKWKWIDNNKRMILCYNEYADKYIMIIQHYSTENKKNTDDGELIDYKLYTADATDKALRHMGGILTYNGKDAPIWCFCPSNTITERQEISRWIENYIYHNDGEAPNWIPPTLYEE